MGGDGGFRILAGVDGSVPSRLALEWAVTEARLRHGQVRVVTAWEFPPVAVGMEAWSGTRTSSRRPRAVSRTRP
ncbi:universal stress protein [Pseudarthrobacter sp. HLT3-5]|uniref:universal stress protein n=1 Tax=Pseudarthrobacter cellobiosi TaxID=2953654 RepID=UPI00208F08B5|nr:universal stress protein [Pseudarthrobacter sp. HLT3-5]MCO4273611.1 universal stress protein [Pseudarthrobacter sp. HLT3-5]